MPAKKHNNNTEFTTYIRPRKYIKKNMDSTLYGHYHVLKDG